MISDPPVASSTADAATRRAAPYMLAKRKALTPGAIAAVSTAERKASCGSAGGLAQDPGHRRMQDERDGADIEDRAQVALGPVAVEHAAQAEQRRGKRRSREQRHRLGKDAGERQARQVDGEAEKDADDQRVVEHRGGDAARHRQGTRAAVARDLHRGHAQAVAERRVQGDDRVVRGQRVGAIGALGDRQAEEHGVGEQAAEADRHRIRPAAAEQEPRAQKPGEEACDRADVEAQEQRRVEAVAQVQPGDGAKQQAGDRELLGIAHQRLDAVVAEQPAPDRGIARADDQKDRQDHLEEGLHLRPPSGASCRHGRE